MNIIKRVGMGLLTGLFLLLSIAPAQAQQSDLLSGQKHYYSALFRGNGEAIVYARIVLTNNDTKPQNDFNFEIPRATVNEFVAFQQTLPQVCKRYNYSKRPSVCTEYGDGDYASDYVSSRDSEKANYEEITPEVSGQAYKLKLAKPLEPEKSTAIIIAYSAEGYVSNFLGKNIFEFETFRVDKRVQLAKVTVDVDTDQTLKGQSSSVNYDQNNSVASTATSEGAALSTQSLDRVSSQLGNYGSMVKEAKNLAPYETFIVKGEYTDSWFLLYLGEIITAFLIILALLTGFYLLAKWTNKKQPKTTFSNTSSKKPHVKDTFRNNAKLGFRESINTPIVGMGLISALLVIGLVVSSSNLDKVLFIEDETISLIVGIGILILSILLIAAPLIFIGSKYGWRAVITALIAMALWLLTIAVLFSVLFQSSNKVDPYPDDRPGYISPTQPQ